MANKVMKIETEIAPKPSTAMQRELKKLGAEVQKTFGPQAMKATEKALDKHIKGLQQTIKLTKEQGKIYKEHVLKPLEEHEKVYKRIVTQVEKAQRTMNGPALGDRWLQRQIARGTADAESYARADRMNAGDRTRAQGNFLTGMDVIERRRAADAEEEKTKRMENVAKIMAVGAATQVAGRIIGAVGDVTYGQSMRKAQYGAEAAGFAGKMYNDLNNGDFTGLAAVMRNPAAMAQFKEIVSDSKTRSQFAQVGAGVGAVGGVIMGAGQTALGAGMMMSGAGAGMGGLNVSQGIGSLTGSVGDLAGVVAANRAGKTAADVSSAAIQGMEYMKKLDPVRLRQMQELQGRTRQIAEFGALSGFGAKDTIFHGFNPISGKAIIKGSQGGDPSLKMAEMQRMGWAGGISSLEETMGLYGGLRNVMTARSAMDPTNMLAITQSPFRMGIGRESAIQGMGAMSRMAEALSRDRTFRNHNL